MLQPTTRLLYASTMAARKRKLCQVGSYVMSATHNAFGSVVCA